MSRMTKPRHKICRTLGEPICGSPKCPALKRPYPPGQHGQAKQRRKVSEFGVRLREKQKLRYVYGLTERQFRGVFEFARDAKNAPTGERFLQLLESRLDNVIYRLGFGRSRPAARQLVAHGHVFVNGRKVDIPSYSVRPGDRISIRPESRQLDVVQAAVATAPAPPNYLTVDREQLEGSIVRLPSREEIPVKVDEKLIVEYYSR